MYEAIMAEDLTVLKIASASTQETEKLCHTWPTSQIRQSQRL